MSRKIIKTLGKARFFGINHIENSQDAKPRQKIVKKGSVHNQIVIKNGRETYNRNESQRSHHNVNNIWFFNKGLLPTFDEIFWIHKRWKTECPASCPKKLTPEGGKLDPATPQPKVVIVGAGLAGLSAASRLAEAGFGNYQIIEATDRVGGRIHSCWVGDVVAELGAPWLPSATLSNPLYSLAAQEDLLRPPLAWRVVPADPPFLTDSGRELETRVARPAASLYRAVREQALSLAGKSAPPCASLGDFMRLRLQEALKSVPEEWRADVDKVFWGLANELKTEYGASEKELSRELFGSQVRLPGDSLRVQLGLLGILGPLMRRIDPKRITTSRSVESICWESKSPRAQVRLSGGETVGADLVLVTVPLGVLKESPNLFYPCLPEEKLGAIERVGWGTLNRFILCYEKPFWLPGEAFYRFAWGPDQRNDSQSWLKGLSVVEEVAGVPNMLTFALGGEEAEMTEDCADDSIIDQLTKALRRFSGDSTLPYPKGLVRSKWRSDHRFRGSLSHMSVRTAAGDYCELSRPVPDEKPVLLFAGEATAPGHAATLLGAHLSGVREADRILRLSAKFAVHTS